MSLATGQLQSFPNIDHRCGADILKTYAKILKMSGSNPDGGGRKRVLVVGRSELDLDDNSVSTSKYSLLTFFPIVSLPPLISSAEAKRGRSGIS